MREKQMSEVVERLRDQQSEALLELIEFDHALDEFLRGFESLCAAAQELDAAARAVPPSAHSNDDALLTEVRVRADRGNASASQILRAFRQLRHAVKLWNIAGPRRPSNGPMPDSNSRH